MLVWVNNDGSGETAHMRRLAWTFAVRICYDTFSLDAVHTGLDKALSWPKRVEHCKKQQQQQQQNCSFYAKIQAIGYQRIYGRL